MLITPLMCLYCFLPIWWFPPQEFFECHLVGHIISIIVVVLLWLYTEDTTFMPRSTPNTKNRKTRRIKSSRFISLAPSVQLFPQFLSMFFLLFFAIEIDRHPHLVFLEFIYGKKYFFSSCKSVDIFMSDRYSNWSMYLCELSTDWPTKWSCFRCVFSPCPLESGECFSSDAINFIFYPPKSTLRKCRICFLLQT